MEEIFDSVIKSYFGNADDRAVRSLFGLSIAMMSYVYSIIAPGLSPKKLLIALHFMRLYLAESVSALAFRIDPKTYRKHVSFAIAHLDSYLPEVI